MKGRYPNFVNGRMAEPAGRTYDTLTDPCTGAPFAEVARSTSEDVDTAFQAAREAFPGWAGLTPGERQTTLLQTADLLAGAADRIAAIESRNTGKPRRSTRVDEIDVAVDVIRFFAGAARATFAPSAGEYLPGFLSYVRREPVGVCAQMVPFNYPLLMAVWKLAPALAAGNTVVLKPSHNTPLSLLAFAELAAEALPPGALNVVCGDRYATESITTHPVASHVSATASTASGIAIATTALSTVKRLHLGLGGKAPAIVFPDADIPTAAACIASAAFFNGGQDCTAASRVLVHSAVHDEFVAEFAKQAAALTTGPPDAEPTAFYGPLNSAAQVERIVQALAGLPPSATTVTGGEPLDRKGFFFPPTVITDVTVADAIVSTELFGPVATVESFTDQDDATRLANATDYGLASSIHTRDHDTALRLSAALDYGCVWVNTHLPLASEMPHGGFKQSGFGKDLSSFGLDEFTRIKHVMHHLP